MLLKAMTMSKTPDKKGQGKTLNTKTLIGHTTYLLAFSLTLFWKMWSDLFREKSSKKVSSPKEDGINMFD